MSAKRGESGLAGILVVDKPEGLTSHDVVNRVRRALDEKRVGHAGTLDPMATGVLVVLVGPATRLAPYLTAAVKSYLARIVFGSATDTDDAEGRIVCSAPVPDEAADPFAAAGVVASLVGTHEQVPPAFSAIKVGGKTAYRAARAGETLALEPRTVEVVSARLAGVELEPEIAWDVELSVSKGTYIRALARDLGEAMGSAAHLGALRRTSSGHLTLDDAVALEQIARAGPQARKYFHDPVLALGLPALDIDEAAAAQVRDGRPLSISALGPESGSAAVIPTGLVPLRFEDRLLALYETLGDNLVPQVVFPGGIEAGAR